MVDALSLGEDTRTNQGSHPVTRELTDNYGYARRAIHAANSH